MARICYILRSIFGASENKVNEWVAFTQVNRFTWYTVRPPLHTRVIATLLIIRCPEELPTLLLAHHVKSGIQYRYNKNRQNDRSPKPTAAIPQAPTISSEGYCRTIRIVAKLPKLEPVRC